MSRADRAVYRTLRHLQPDETLMASTVGYENEGRRRQVVLLTDRRIIVTGLRSDPHAELPLKASSASFEPDPPRLVLHQGTEAQAVVRDVEATAARQIVALLDVYRALPESATAPRVQHVHIRHRPPDAPGT